MVVDIALNGDINGQIITMDLDELNRKSEDFLKVFPEAEVIYSIVEWDLLHSKTKFPIAVVND